MHWSLRTTQTTLGEKVYFQNRKTKEIKWQFVNHVVDWLDAKRINPWIDWRNIDSGVDWWEAIVAGIRECEAVIVVLSEEYEKSKVSCSSCDAFLVF